MNWRQDLPWLEEFFRRSQSRIHRIAQASGCRELWLQGEIYLFLNNVRILTNATRKKYDILLRGECILEMKFLGGNYQSKVYGLLQRDFDKVALHEGPERRYVLLVLDDTRNDTALYSRLRLYEDARATRLFEREYAGFTIILWSV